MRNTITLNNYEFNFEEKGSGEKILLVHGSSSDYRTWRNQIDTLSKEYHVFAYSRRYHWPNEKIKEGIDYSMKEHVEDLKKMIEYLGKESINLVGHSYGALIGIELASNHPELINKLVLSEPPAIRLFVSNIPKLGELLKLIFSRPKTALSIIKLGATGIDPATKAAKKGDMKSAMQLSGKAILGTNHFNKLSEARKEQAFVNLSAAELTGSGFLPLDQEKLRKIEIPILLVTGELSPKVFSNLADRLEELFLNLKRVEISEASHIMHEDNYEEFNSEIVSFFNKK